MGELMWCPAFFNCLTAEDGELDEEYIEIAEKIAVSQAVPYYENDDYAYYIYKYPDTVAELLMKCRRTGEKTVELLGFQTIIRKTEPMKRTLLAAHEDTGICVLSGESGLLVVYMDPMGYKAGDELYVHPYIYAAEMEWYPDEETYYSEESRKTKAVNPDGILISAGSVFPVSSMMMGNREALGLSEEELNNYRENQTYSFATGSLTGYERDELKIYLEGDDIPEGYEYLQTGIFEVLQVVKEEFVTEQCRTIGSGH